MGWVFAGTIPVELSEQAPVPSSSCTAESSCFPPALHGSSPQALLLQGKVCTATVSLGTAEGPGASPPLQPGCSEVLVSPTVFPLSLLFQRFGCAGTVQNWPGRAWGSPDCSSQRFPPAPGLGQLEHREPGA